MVPVPGNAIVHGVAAHAQWVRGEAGLTFSIPLAPMAWYRLIGQRASGFAERVSLLEELLGADAERLYRDVSAAGSVEERASAADRILLARLATTRRNRTSDLIEAVALAVADPECGTVSELATRVGLSQAQLGRLTRDSFGFMPKTLIRRERFLRMFHSMWGLSVNDWASFLDPQYVDQSHMIRDFQHFIGMSPTRYFALDRPMRTAVYLALMHAIAEGKAPGLFVAEEGRQTLTFQRDTD
jgi:AraC-like DNA-binding protein